MGQLADYSIVGDVDRCNMPEPNDQDDSEAKIIAKIPCCNDVLELIESTNTKLKISKEFSLDDFGFLAIFMATYINLFEGLQENVIPFNGHSPPILTKDIQVLYQTYLI